MCDCEALLPDIYLATDLIVKKMLIVFIDANKDTVAQLLVFANVGVVQP